jgi:hypothetical protein
VMKPYYLYGESKAVEATMHGRPRLDAQNIRRAISPSAIGKARHRSARRRVLNKRARQAPAREIRDVGE